MAIRTRPRTKNEAAMEQFRSMTRESRKLDLVGQIQEHAEAIGHAMASLHGVTFKVRVDHECAFVFVTPDR
jgi:hypothetical protein